MGELIAAMSAAAPAAAGSAGTAASLAGSAAEGIGGMFAAPVAAPTSALSSGLLNEGLLGTTGTPFFTTPEAFMGGVPMAEGVGMSAMGPMFDAAQLPFATMTPGASGAWDQALTTGLSDKAGTAAKGFPWGKATEYALSQMKNGPETIPKAMGSRPPGYSPTDPMEVQFARIMGWLRDNGGRA